MQLKSGDEEDQAVRATKARLKYLSSSTSKNNKKFSTSKRSVTRYNKGRSVVNQRDIDDADDIGEGSSNVVDPRNNLNDSTGTYVSSMKDRLVLFVEKLCRFERLKKPKSRGLNIGASMNLSAHASKIAVFILSMLTIWILFKKSSVATYSHSHSHVHSQFQSNSDDAVDAVDAKKGARTVGSPGQLVDLDKAEDNDDNDGEEEEEEEPNLEGDKNTNDVVFTERARRRGAGDLDDDDDGDDDDVGAPRPAPVEQFVSVKDASAILKPFEMKDGIAICPEMGGKNKLCSKAYVEFQFDVSMDVNNGKPPGPGKYFLYVQTVAPNINDNSLWVSPPLNSNTGEELDSSDKRAKTFLECDSKMSAGPLVPHKHVAKGKLKCCPKYLDKNAKKGLVSFYTDCCSTTIGPKGDSTGCLLDLEVDSKPHWNMVPRTYLVEKGKSSSTFSSSSSVLRIRLYAREDGTAISGVFLSKDSKKSTRSMP